MKLLSIENYVEGISLASIAYITIGRRYSSKLEKNGVFVIIRSPKVVKNVKQLCPFKFVEKVQDCRKAWMFSIRRMHGSGKWSKTMVSALVPL